MAVVEHLVIRHQGSEEPFLLAFSMSSMRLTIFGLGFAKAERFSSPGVKFSLR